VCLLVSEHISTSVLNLICYDMFTVSITMVFNITVYNSILICYTYVFQYPMDIYLVRSM